ncbi:MAG: DUF1059 domain-containing protein [Sulfolobaceae archaeon]
MVFGFRRKKKFNFSCRSAGMDCLFEIIGASSEEEVMEILKVHARRVHGLGEVSNDLVKRGISRT